MKLREGFLLLAISLLAGCTGEIARSCQNGVTSAIDEVVLRPVLFMECTYAGADVTDSATGEVTMRSGTSIRADMYLARPLLSDGSWVGFALFDETTGVRRELLFDDIGGRSDWVCTEPVSGDPVRE